MLWLKQGDLNSKFLHNMADIRSHKKRISVINDNLNNSFSDQIDIDNCFTSFSLYLWSPNYRWSFNDLVKPLPSDHNTMSEEDITFLIKQVSYREILITIKSMGKGKSHGPDVLNIYFYLFYCDIIKEPLFRVIS